MKICDAHVHLGKSGPWQPYMDPTIYVDELIRLFDKYNVERAIVFPNPSVGDEYPKMNNYKAKSVKKYPKRLIGFGRVDPRREDAIKELIRIKNGLGLTGIKLHPMVECFRPDHPFFEEFFKKTNALNLPILFHSGDGGLFGSDIPYYRYPTQIAIVELQKFHRKLKEKFSMKISKNCLTKNEG